jgi:acetyl esterase/lipase
MKTALPDTPRQMKTACRHHCLTALCTFLTCLPGMAGEPAADGRAEPSVRTAPLGETFVFRKIDAIELRLHVVRPDGWRAADRRACLIAFFGGGWSSGTPERSIKWARWAAEHGLVGIAPDYRTRERFGSVPEDCVSDGRAALRWVQEHAAGLGIDPGKIIVQGTSAGGHVAAWTAIPSPGPGEDDPSPETGPAAMILVCPVTDTKEGGYGGPKRFGGSPERARASSVTDQMSSNMPPAIVFHATGDETVPYANSTVFRDQMTAHGNGCELITFEGLGHSYFAASRFGEAGAAADKKTYAEAAGFLTRLGLMEEDISAPAH